MRAKSLTSLSTQTACFSATMSGMIRLYLLYKYDAVIRSIVSQVSKKNNDNVYETEMTQKKYVGYGEEKEEWLWW